MKVECPFCEIHKEQRILQEANYNFVIFSNPRIQPGHLLVIPKRHITKLIELNSSESSELLGLLTKYQEKILTKLSLGCEIRQNLKPYHPNSRTHVNHLHFHIHPRSLGDEVELKVDKHRKPLYTELTNFELEKMRQMLAD